MTILYQVLIAPIETVMHLVLSATYAALGSYGVSIFALSLLINLALLPLFQLAEKWQEAERRVQLILQPKLQEFKKAFSGEERYTMIHTLYRQTGYHPIFAMRSSLGLLLQLPFWIAAYQLLSHYQPLEGASFLLFEDLGKPDKLLWGINLLPFVMTGANLLAAFVYTKQLSLKEKIQPLFLALLFLILLYNSPTGLLLYWTFNSLLSLARIALFNPTQPVKSSRVTLSMPNLQRTHALSPPILSPEAGEGSVATEGGKTILARFAECRGQLARLIKLSTSFNFALFFLVVGLQLLVHPPVRYSAIAEGFLHKNGLASMTAIGLSIAILAYLCIMPLLRRPAGTERNLRQKLNVMLIGLLWAAFVLINVSSLSKLNVVPDSLSNSGEFRAQADGQRLAPLSNSSVSSERVWFKPDEASATRSVGLTLAVLLLALLILLFGSPMCNEVRILRTMPEDHWLFASSTYLGLFVLFIANPVSVYISSQDFVGGVYNVTGQLLFYFVAVALTLTTLYGLADKSARNGLTLLSVFSSVSLVVYSGIGLKDVGLMDQFMLDFPAALTRTKYEIVGEIALLVLLFGLTSYTTINYRNNVTYVVVAMLVTSVSMTAVDLYGAKAPPVVEGDGLPVDHADIIGFSRDRNVLIIMLDGFPGGYIKRIQNEASQVLKEYEGFVWYPNMLTTNAGTWGSIATLLGGHKYTVGEINNRTEKSLRSAINAAYGVYTDAFIPKGYQVTYVNPAGSGGCERLDKRVHCTFTLPYGIHYRNQEDASVSYNADSNFPLMLTMVSFLKASPFILKSWIYDKGGYRGANSPMMIAKSYKAREWGFLRVLARESNADSLSKTFKFIQLSIPHTPQALNNECKLQPEYATTFTETVCALKEVGALLARMKEIGVYDATKIVVVSDHGWVVDNPMFPPEFVKMVPEGWQQRASAGFLQSLLLVKDFGAKGRLSQSDSFLSTPDVPSLVCSTDVTCREVLPDQTKTNVEERGRVFNITAPPLDEEKTNKFHIIESYEVRNNIFDAGNWKRIK